MQLEEVEKPAATENIIKYNWYGCDNDVSGLVHTVYPFIIHEYWKMIVQAKL